METMNIGWNSTCESTSSGKALRQGRSLQRPTSRLRALHHSSPVSQNDRIAMINCDGLNPWVRLKCRCDGHARRRSGMHATTRNECTIAGKRTIVYVRRRIGAMLRGSRARGRRSRKRKRRCGARLPTRWLASKWIATTSPGVRTRKAA